MVPADGGECEPDLSLHKVTVLAAVLPLVLSGLACLLYPVRVGMSVLVGGAVSTISFFLLKRDMVGLLAGPLAAVKARFFIRYYLRLALLAVLLFVLIKSDLVDPLALLVGLSTVLLSVALTVVLTARNIFRR